MFWESPSVLFKLQRAQESHGDPVKMQALIQKVWGGAEVLHF